MQKYLALRAQYAVISHEMGHSIGLRHNFVSSSDAFNYRPQYWQLRTDNGANTSQCTQLTPNGSCVGPRYYDPLTDNERKNLITMFMQSSTMDYAGEATQDLLGLGAYDFAAARMFYGETAAVFKDQKYRASSDLGAGALAKLDNFGGILGFRPSIGSGNNSTDIHYSQLQRYYSLISNCQTVDPETFKPATWNEELRGKWDPLLDGQIVKVNGQYTRCKTPKLDYVTWSDLRNPGSSDTSRAGHVTDANGRVRFPYGFGTDSWADLGNLSVYRHDNGADPYELFDFLITQQEVNHIFDNYRRNRQNFSVRSASSRTLSRYNEKLRDAAKGLGLMVNVYKDFSLDMGYDFDALWPVISTEYFGENILASGMAFDHFARQMSRPQMGPHYLSQQGAVENGRPILKAAADAAGNTGATAMSVPNGATSQRRHRLLRQRGHRRSSARERAGQRQG
jgi:hypothetical protein